MKKSKIEMMLKKYEEHSDLVTIDYYLDIILTHENVIKKTVKQMKKKHPEWNEQQILDIINEEAKHEIDYIKQKLNEKLNDTKK